MTKSTKTSNTDEDDKTKKININWVHENKSIPKEKLQLSESGIDFFARLFKDAIYENKSDKKLQDHDK